MKLDILTYNIHKGFDLFNQEFILRELRSAIQSTHSDIVFLQEVVGHHAHHAARVEAWPEETQFEFLADSVWGHFAYGKNAVYDHGHHGNAILSKYPIVSWEHEDISTNTMEQRGLLHCIINLSPAAMKVHCICIHLSLFGRGRRKQIERICERIADEVPEHEPLILAGDLNDWRDIASPIFEERLGLHEVFRIKEGMVARSFPCHLPFFRLDRIYQRGFHVHSVERLAGERWSDLSDHAALRTQLELD